jgi:hypothetical protein
LRAIFISAMTPGSNPRASFPERHSLLVLDEKERHAVEPEHFAHQIDEFSFGLVRIEIFGRLTSKMFGNARLVFPPRSGRLK